RGGPSDRREPEGSTPGRGDRRARHDGGARRSQEPRRILARAGPRGSVRRPGARLADEREAGAESPAPRSVDAGGEAALARTTRGEARRRARVSTRPPRAGSVLQQRARLRRSEGVLGEGGSARELR